MKETIKKYYKTTYISPIGELTLISDGTNLIGLRIEGQKYFSIQTEAEIELKDNLDIFEDTKNWLDKYFKGDKPEIKELPIAFYGSNFRQTIWKILCEIPYGEVTTYGNIAKKFEQKQGIKKMSAQAVGGAIGHNPISIIVPCHRVIGTNGSFTGYAGGIKTKIKLLEHEKVDITKFFIPKKSTAP